MCRVTDASLPLLVRVHSHVRPCPSASPGPRWPCTWGSCSPWALASGSPGRRSCSQATQTSAVRRRCIRRVFCFLCVCCSLACVLRRRCAGECERMLACGVWLCAQGRRRRRGWRRPRGGRISWRAARATTAAAPPPPHTHRGPAHPLKRLPSSFHSSALALFSACRFHLPPACTQPTPGLPTHPPRYPRSCWVSSGTRWPPSPQSPSARRFSRRCGGCTRPWWCKACSRSGRSLTSRQRPRTHVTFLAHIRPNHGHTRSASRLLPF